MCFVDLFLGGSEDRRAKSHPPGRSSRCGKNNSGRYSTRSSVLASAAQQHRSGSLLVMLSCSPYVKLQYVVHVTDIAIANHTWTECAFCRGSSVVGCRRQIHFVSHVCCSLSPVCVNVELCSLADKAGRKGVPFLGLEIEPEIVRPYVGASHFRPRFLAQKAGLLSGPRSGPESSATPISVCGRVGCCSCVVCVNVLLVPAPRTARATWPTLALTVPASEKKQRYRSDVAGVEPVFPESVCVPASEYQWTVSKHCVSTSDGSAVVQHERPDTSRQAFAQHEDSVYLSLLF